MHYSLPDHPDLKNKSMCTINNNKVILLLALFIILLVIPGCQKDTTVIVPTVTTVTKTVLFSKDIVPLFTANCALSGCHASGGHIPNLTAGQAYNSLLNGNYVNKATAESSILYKRLTGVLSPAMPLGAASNPSNINGLVLAWIKQGAKNN
jgi:hypothetical protein